MERTLAMLRSQEMLSRVNDSPLGLERWVRVSQLKNMTRRVQSRGTACAKFLK